MDCEDENKAFKESILFKIDNKINLSSKDISEIVNNPDIYVETETLEEVPGDYGDYRLVIQLDCRFFIIEYRYVSGNHFSEFQLLEQPYEATPTERTVTIIDYVPKSD